MTTLRIPTDAPKADADAALRSWLRTLPPIDSHTAALAGATCERVPTDEPQRRRRPRRTTRGGRKHR